jgi:pyruvate/2-oxoglutarate dehydrogenase complex dihydrolipoamide dehydrogenase (E3) component
MPSVDGLEKALACGFALTIDAILAGESLLPPGPVAIWGASEGIELALDLRRRGHLVRLFDPKPAFAPAAYIGSRSRPLLRWLAQAKLAVETGTELLAVETDHLQLRHADGRTESVHCNKLLLAPGRVADDALSGALMRKGVIVQVIGDARAPRSYGNAIHEAAYLARRI